MPEKTKLLIAPCSYKASKYAIMNWHYSKCMPAGKCQTLGIWENDKFMGAVVIGTGAGNITLGKQYGLAKMRMAEITRVALTTHKTTVSRLLSICIKIVKRNNDKLRLLVSLADPIRNHIGTIYQAQGWIYVGKTAESKTYIGYDGKEYHERVVSPTGRKKQYSRYVKCMKPKEAKSIRINPGKHKYLYPLDKEMRKQIEPLRKPYPKRPVGETVSRPANQPEVSGSIPTTGLK